MEKNFTEMQVDCLEEMYKENLKIKMKHLISNLERELEQLEKNPNYKPNSCGIIQGQSVEIDELAVKLGVLDRIKGTFIK